MALPRLACLLAFLATVITAAGHDTQTGSPGQRPSPAAASAVGAVPAFLPGQRVLLDAHNAYPDGDRFADRIDRALATGLPIAIEQDLVWFHDPQAGRARSIVSHGEPFTGREPSLDEYVFARIKPLVERALAEGRHDAWPLIVLNLDLKTNEPEHHRALWDTLGRYESWLTTAPRQADPTRVMPLDVRPVLVLTGNPDAQQKSFHDDVPIGSRLRLFGALRADLEPLVGRGREALDRLVDVAPRLAIPTPATNYRRWTNHSWALVERGGQAAAAAWTPDDARRLEALVARAHQLGLWIRFYTLNGHPAAEGTETMGWNADYNFGSLGAARERWVATVAARVDFIATDQYEELSVVLRSARAPR
jgi:hypothetical protein